MKDEEKAKELFHEFKDATLCGAPLSRGSVAFQASLKMAEWKDEQFKRQKQKLKEFETWLYNKQSDFKYEGMREELVGLNAVIQKFEELGL